jgi:hypothetical protein
MLNWLADNDIGAGSQDPKKVPYYLLLVGSPEKIPFEFEYQLDVEYAVGRLDFDRPEEYAAYAASVIASERGALPARARETVFFGTRHLFDKPTKISADHLITPLANGLDGETPVCQQYGFGSRLLLGEAARRAALCDVLAPPSGAPGPALLFTAGHGMGLKLEDPDQPAVNGALLCQDWPGYGEMNPGCYLTGADVPAAARVGGLVAFFFACYGAGTPKEDRYVHKEGSRPPQIAARPFTAALPKKLLAHPNGGALAVIGHVEKAWAYSIETLSAGVQIGPFRNTVARLLHGEPVGHAVQDFNQRYAVISNSLTDDLEERSFGKQYADEELVNAWVRRNDAQGYLLLGDPAVRLHV